MRCLIAFRILSEDVKSGQHQVTDRFLARIARRVPYAPLPVSGAPLPEYSAAGARRVQAGAFMTSA